MTNALSAKRTTHLFEPDGKVANASLATNTAINLHVVSTDWRSDIPVLANILVEM